MTDSLNGSDSMLHRSSSSSHSFDEAEDTKLKTISVGNSWKITVKATDKCDMVRFKFERAIFWVLPSSKYTKKLPKGSKSNMGQHPYREVSSP
ncbi:hypothetical protein V6N13_048362 [Hibiscus sabdariffa]|uniref:Uncharacterized protein n=1 Tax=Hibiscus sabdariffa TaxID=183260 RepID=A0ABR2F707_9ROSI